jgi:hypothetical protein
MLRKFFEILFTFSLFTALASCANKELATPQITNNLLKITLTSQEQKEFPYKKWGAHSVDVEFNIKNISNSNININLEYIQAAGLWLALKDRKTGPCADAWPGFPIMEKVKPFTTLHAGEKMAIKDTVSDFHLEECQQRRIDLDLEIGTGSPIQANDPSIYVILNDVTPVPNTEKPPTSN